MDPVEYRRVRGALVLRVGAVAPDELTRVLQRVRAGRRSVVVFIIDVRNAGVLTVGAARILVAFAQASGRDGRAAAVVLDQGPTAPRIAQPAATALVLDRVDPAGVLDRFSTVEQALAATNESSSPGHTSAHRLPVTETTHEQRMVYDGHDPDQTEEFLSTLYAPLRIHHLTGGSHAHITRATAGPVSVDHLDLPFTMSYQVDPLDKWALCEVDAGTVEQHQAHGWREPDSFGPGDVVMLAPPDRCYAGRIHGSRYTVTLLDPTLLDAVAGTPRTVQLRDHHPTSPHTAKQVKAVLAHLRDHVLSTPEARANPLITSTVSRYLAAAVLNAFPNSADDDTPTTTVRDNHDAHPQTLRRALAFIDANAAHDIDAADIARAAYVSLRAVQLAFRRHLNTTPMTYLRHVRLDSAHNELRAATPHDTTVTAVAARWGYTRPSVFTTRYHTAYGQLPSQTLRND